MRNSLFSIRTSKSVKKAFRSVISILSIVSLIASCSTIDPSGSLSPARPKPKLLASNIWVPSVIFSDETAADPMGFEHGITKNIVDYLRQSDAFDQVRTPPGKMHDDELMLKFEVTKYKHTMGINAFGGPAMLFTLGIYAVLGLPVYTEKVLVSAKLEVKNAKGELLAQAEDTKYEKDWYGLYGVEPPSTAAIKAELLESLLNQTILKLKSNGV